MDDIIIPLLLWATICRTIRGHRIEGATKDEKQENYSSMMDEFYEAGIFKAEVHHGVRCLVVPGEIAQEFVQSQLIKDKDRPLPRRSVQ